MAKRDHFLRYIGIINKLRHHGPATYEEIMDYLDMQSEIRDFRPDMSKRTFQRDIREIASLFNIEIAYDFSAKVYYINLDDDSRELSNRLLEAFDVMNLCNAAESVSPYVIFEKRRPQGTHLFNGLLDAIRNKIEVTFAYHKYWDDEVEVRSVQPYALKESRERWYLVSRDMKDHKVKTFALDRIRELKQTNKKFSRPSSYNPNEEFKHCFGVMGDDKAEPSEIVLSIRPFQGKYIKSFPLHESQRVLKDDRTELRIRLCLYITRDFIMELLSLGDTVRVISPKKLRTELCKNHKLAIDHNA